MNDLFKLIAELGAFVQTNWPAFLNLAERISQIALELWAWGVALAEILKRYGPFKPQAGKVASKISPFTK